MSAEREDRKDIKTNLPNALITQMRIIAATEGKNLYEVYEDAVRTYIAQWKQDRQEQASAEP